jgi:2-dehydropantoate 2-reductase
MRIVVYGLGAIGSAIAGFLARSGQDVTGIARGATLERLRREPLGIERPSGPVTVRLPVVDGPGAIDWADDDLVVLAVKSQHTAGVLAELARFAPATLPVVCAQNGVHNEQEALRYFRNVYGIAVLCPTALVRPGVVQSYAEPVPGILDVGRWPAGADDHAARCTTALAAAGFSSRPEPEVSRWKWRKLLANLDNAVDAICGPDARRSPLSDRAITEGRACLAAAGIQTATAEEERARRGDLLHVQPVGGAGRPGASTWQSLARRTGSIETPYLNGEMVLLGAVHGVPTPVNAMLVQVMARLAHSGAGPGSISLEQLTAMAGPAVAA